MKIVGWCSIYLLFINPYNDIIAFDKSGNHHGSGVISETPDSVFQVGEELTYNVSYASIDIGRIRVKQLETIAKGNRTTYRVTAYIDSYKGIPFVNLHSIFESKIDEANYSTWFHARDKQDDQWMSYIYNFDYAKHAMYIEESVWKSEQIIKRDTLQIDTLSQDGLSLLFFARRHVRIKHQLNVPAIVNEKKGNTFISFTGERRKEEIEAVKYPLDLVYLEGMAGFVGIFGFTGGFEGWFSNDSACVPMLAKMKVLIGKIRIELIEWKREGWAPPRYVEDKNR